MTARPKLPRIKLRDLDWKLVLLLIVFWVVTFADDPTVIGEMLDPLEIAVDMVTAYVLGKRTLQRAADRQDGDVVSGKVVPDATELDVSKTGSKRR